MEQIEISIEFEFWEKFAGEMDISLAWLVCVLWYMSYTCFIVVAIIAFGGVDECCRDVKYQYTQRAMIDRGSDM